MVAPARLGGRPRVCCGTLLAYMCLCAGSGSSLPVAVAVTSWPLSMAVTLSTVAKSGCHCLLGSPWSFTQSRICVCACTDGVCSCSAARLCMFATIFPPRLAVSTCALSDGLVVALAVAWPMLQICFPALRCTFSFAWLVIGLQSFMCTMAEASLRQHAESKHPKSTFELCFPTYAKA